MGARPPVRDPDAGRGRTRRGPIRQVPCCFPPDAPESEFPLLASLDCGALSEEVTGLPPPPDGRLLLFALPDMDEGGDRCTSPKAWSSRNGRAAPTTTTRSFPMAIRRQELTARRFDRVSVSMHWNP